MVARTHLNITFMYTLPVLLFIIFVTLISVSPGESVSTGNVMQALQQEGVQRAEGTSQLQDWNVELNPYPANVENRVSS